MAKKEVELDFDAFIASIENWDGEYPPFDEVMRSALMLATLMMRGEQFRAGLQEKLECAGSTISRYAMGVARPMPGVMRLVVRETRATLIGLDAQAKKDHSAMILFMRNIGNCGSDD